MRMEIIQRFLWGYQMASYKSTTSNMFSAEKMIARKIKTVFDKLLPIRKKKKPDYKTKKFNVRDKVFFFSSCIGSVNVLGRMLWSQKGLDNLFTWYVVQHGKISVILISCDEDTSKTRQGKKFRWRYCMTYSKCQSHKALVLKKDVLQRGKEIPQYCWTLIPKEKRIFPVGNKTYRIHIF